ncbi:MAG: glycosyltransferase, partial [Zetaproteobacteria bacterium]
MDVLSAHNECLPAVSVLICTRNRRAWLAALLKDLRAQRYPGAVQIVVVEETDDTQPVEGVDYVPHPVRNLGLGFARNLALRHARHEIVV